MPPSQEVIRIQAYLRESARRQYQETPVGPFTVFINPRTDFKYFNYAIPDRPDLEGQTDAEAQAALEDVKAVFQARDRRPRFEFFEAYTPRLGGLLRANGFVEEGRQWSMLCRPRDFSLPPSVAGLEVTRLDAEHHAREDVRDFLLAQQQGFNPENTEPVDEAAIDEQARGYRESGWRGLLGRVGLEPAGVASYAHPIYGVSEIAAVATREAFRRRGIGAYLTALATQAAFDAGAETACLTAEDERAGRMYERLGYQPFSVMLAYLAEE